MTKHKIYVYGTLRPMGADTQRFKGQLYHLGGFPGVKNPTAIPCDDDDPDSFVCEAIECDDRGLAGYDRYEGYNPDDPNRNNNLYNRQPFADGFIYVYNGSVSERERVTNGDWSQSANPRVVSFA